MARLLDSTPKRDGFRLPGEFEAKSGCWLGWPERTDVWRNGAKPAQKVWVQIVTAISHSEPVTVCASAAQFATARRQLPPQVRVVEMTCNDTWFRDSGPCFVVNDQSGEVRGVDFEFNAYGGLDGGLYYPWDKDDQIASKILEIERFDRYRAPLIAELGGIQSDGQGSILTTEQCLLNRNRNQHLGKDEVTRRLTDYLGAEQVIWLPRGCKFDETDGHVDDLACFVRPGEVVLQWTDNRDDPQWEIYQEAYDILRSTRDSRGRELIVHKLPQPDVLEWTAEEAEGLDQQDSTHTRQAAPESARRISTTTPATARSWCRCSVIATIRWRWRPSPNCSRSTRLSASRIPGKSSSVAATSRASPCRNTPARKKEPDHGPAQTE